MSLLFNKERLSQSFTVSTNSKSSLKSAPELSKPDAHSKKSTSFSIWLNGKILVVHPRQSSELGALEVFTLQPLQWDMLPHAKQVNISGSVEYNTIHYIQYIHQWVSGQGQ